MCTSKMTDGHSVVGGYKQIELAKLIEFKFLLHWYRLLSKTDGLFGTFWLSESVTDWLRLKLTYSCLLCLVILYNQKFPNLSTGYSVKIFAHGLANLVYKIWRIDVWMLQYGQCS